MEAKLPSQPGPGQELTLDSGRQCPQSPGKWPGFTGALLAITTSEMPWVSLDREINQKAAYCWPSVTSALRKDRESAAWLVLSPCCPGSSF